MSAGENINNNLKEELAVNKVNYKFYIISFIVACCAIFVIIFPFEVIATILSIVLLLGWKLFIFFW